jgi:DNA-directed RNA polymerase subunit M/transcription elongation factor TFIIS|tara:strand:+ start:140 stop:502 length:363 start_codon:yes stop_codon:yes gene_type:complete
MDVTFCTKCENILYIFANTDEKKLYYGCKSCGNKTEMNSKSQLVYTSNQTKLDKSEIINSNPYITHDITLPTIKGNKNIKCINSDCSSEESDITYIKYDDTNMRYMYICNHCGSKWKNNI